MDEDQNAAQVAAALTNERVREAQATPNPWRVVLDSMVLDLIVADPGVVALIEQLSTDGRLEILTTHVQEDELREIRDEGKAAAVRRVPRNPTPTAGVVLDFSRLGMARLAPAEPIEAVRGVGTSHTADALIAATAAWEGVGLVTEDRRLGKRATAIGVQVFSFDEFAERLAALAT